MDINQAMIVMTSSLDLLTGLQKQFILKYELIVMFGRLQSLFLWNFLKSQTNNDGMNYYVVVSDNEEVGDHT